jgi:hypothetical protein
MRCPHCGEDEVITVDTNCPNPEEPGETLAFGV